MQIPWIGVMQTGRSKNVTAQQRTNIYLDIQKAADKTQIAAYGTPGLVAFANFGANPCRGLWWMQSRDILFAVNGTTLYSIDRAGAYTALGTLSTTLGRVSMSDNGRQLIIVDGSYGYTYTPSTSTFARITDPGFLGGDTVCFLDSYFIVSVPNSQPGQFQISGQYDGTVWNALDYAYAESSPDNIVAVATDNSNLAVFGDISAELWSNTGANAFPFQRMAGAALEYGLAAKWSLARVAGAPTMLLRNRRGQFTIGQLNGYNYTPLSTPDLDFLINQYPSPEDATAFSYFQNGHEFYQISFQGAQRTWLFDATSGTWSSLRGYGITRHRGHLGVSYGNNILISDFENGKLYKLDSSAYDDDGQPLEREIIVPHGYDNSQLNMILCNRLRLDMEGGVGTLTGQGANPKVMLQISRDGGHTYGGELCREFGKIGQFAWRAEWTKLGAARDWIFKLRMTDPVKFALIGAYVDITVANK